MSKFIFLALVIFFPIWGETPPLHLDDSSSKYYRILSITENTKKIRENICDLRQIFLILEKFDDNQPEIKQIKRKIIQKLEDADEYALEILETIGGNPFNLDLD